MSDAILSGFMGADSGPYALTMNDMMQQGIGKILNSVLPGAGPMLSPMVTKWTQKALGIYNDQMLDAVLMSNMTPYGIGLHQQNIAAQRVGRAATDAARYAARFQTFQGLSRTLTSEAAWNKLDPSVRGESYQTYIDAQAADKMNNSMYKFLYEQIDPLGVEMSSRYMGMAASNLIRQGLASGNRNAYANASAVLGNLFRDTKGNFSFDKRDYGYMTQGEVSALTAALTKDTNFLQEADVTKAGTLQSATSRLRDTVKKYAEALSPLKDIFGKDIPSMMKAVEELSGQSLAQMGPERARQVALNALNSTSTGRYSMAELSGVARQFDAAMQRMNIPSINRINATLYGARALDAAQGGFMPAYMTRMGFVNAAANTVLKTANSRGADEFAMAYSLWAQRREQAGEDTSYAAFKSALDASTNKTGNISDAMLDVAGVNNRFDLKQGLSFEYYIRAKQDGLANDLAFDANFKRTQDAARTAMSRSQMFTGALNEQIWRDNYNKFGRRAQYTGADAARIFDAMMETVSGDPSIMNLTGNEKLLAIARRRGFKADSIEDYNKLEQAQKLQVQEIATAMTTVASDDTYRKLYTEIFMAYNMRQQSDRTARIARRRRYTDTLNGEMAGDLKELASTILGLDTGKGMTDESSSAIFNTSTKLWSLGDTETRNETLASLTAGANRAKAAYSHVTSQDWDRETSGNKEYYLHAARQDAEFSRTGSVYKKWLASNNKVDSDASYNEFIRAKAKGAYGLDVSRQTDMIMDMVRYTHSTEGLSNVPYREQLSLFMSAPDKATRDRSAALMGVYRSVNQDAVTDYINNNGMRNGMTDAEKTAQKERNTATLVKTMQESGGLATKNMIEKSSISNRLSGLRSKYSAVFKDLDSEMGDAWLSGTEAFDKSSYTRKVELLRKRYTDILNSGASASDKELAQKNIEGLNSIEMSVNQAIQGQNAQPATLQDILGRLPNVLQELLNWLKANHNTPAVPPQAPAGDPKNPVK